VLHSLTARIVALVAAVAIAGSALTTLAFTRVLGSANEEQAAQTIVNDAQQLAGRLSRNPRLPVRQLPVVIRRQYQVQVDPNRLRAYNLPIGKVVEAVRSGNSDVGGWMYLVLAGSQTSACLVTIARVMPSPTSDGSNQRTPRALPMPAAN